jgi:hypothetical protein
MKSGNFGAVDDLDDLPAMEGLTVELATLAGREIVAAFGTIFTVRYKTDARSTVSLRDPVSASDPRASTFGFDSIELTSDRV